jgi:hypothetical protein
MGEFEWSWLFTPSSLGSWSPQGSFQGKVQKAGAGVGLKTYAPNDFPVYGARLILQEKVIFEQRKVRRNS